MRVLSLCRTAVALCLIVTSGPSQAAAAMGEAPALITARHAEAIYRQLIERHWTPKTGLFRSFPDSQDMKLSQQASTYEQAAMGLLCIRFGDWERAEQLFRFFKQAWDSGPETPGARQGFRGLVNFYNADFGTEGVEKTIHVGPNAWAGLFAARLANARRHPEALQWALDVQYWIAHMVPHERGGVAMGLMDNPYGAPWRRIFSTENNLSYYAFLTELLRHPALDKPIRVSITEERDRVEDWLVRVAYDRSTKSLRRGWNPEGPDRMRALDTVTWLVSAIGPHRLAQRGIDAERLMKEAEKMFQVSVNGRVGVDPTDQDEARRTYTSLLHQPQEINRPETDGHRVIWYEGLGQYILAWTQLAGYARRQGQTQAARDYLAKAAAMTREFDRAALPRYPHQAGYPYATPGVFFRYGWSAPKEGPEGPAVSLISGVWRCFAGLGLDPLAGQPIAVVRQVPVALPADFAIAHRQPAVLYGTSEDMVNEAWRALAAEDLDHAVDQAKATIQEWHPAAQYLQRRKMQDVSHLQGYSGDPKARKDIFKYWALNDVGAAYYILGQAYHHRKDYAKASAAFQQIMTHYSLAQVWDPKGWFWSPAEAVMTDYVQADPAHYGWVMPQLAAERSKPGKPSL